MCKMYGEHLSSHKNSIFAPTSWFKLLEESPKANHLICMKPCKERAKLPYQLVPHRGLGPWCSALSRFGASTHLPERSSVGHPPGQVTERSPPNFPKKNTGFVGILLVHCKVSCCWGSYQVMIYDGYLFFGAESSYQASLRQGLTGWNGWKSNWLSSNGCFQK